LGYDCLTYSVTWPDRLIRQYVPNADIWVSLPINVTMFTSRAYFSNFFGGKDFTEIPVFYFLTDMISQVWHVISSTSGCIGNLKREVIDRWLFGHKSGADLFN